MLLFVLLLCIFISFSQGIDTDTVDNHNNGIEQLNDVVVSSDNCLNKDDESCKSDLMFEEEKIETVVGGVGGVEETGEQNNLQKLDAEEEMLETVLLKEISETVKLISLQQTKVELLEKIRQDLLSGKLSKEARKELVDLDKVLQKSAKFTYQAQNSPLGFGNNNNNKLFFDSYFALRLATAQEDNGVETINSAVLRVPIRGNTAKVTASREGYIDSISMACTLFSNGQVKLYDIMSGQFIDSFSIFERENVEQQKTPIRLTASYSTIPFIYVLYDDGMVSKYNMTILFQRQRVSGLKFEFRWDDEKELQHQEEEEEEENHQSKKFQMAVDLEKKFSIRDLEDENGEPIEPKPLSQQKGEGDSNNNLGIIVADVLDLRRQSALLTSSSRENLLRMHKENTNLGGSLETEHPVTTVGTNGNVVGYSFGKTVRLANPSNLSPTKLLCEPPHGTRVVSIAFDVLIPMIMYIGLDNGQVIVFNTRAKPPTSSSKKGGSGGAICKMKMQVAVQSQLHAEDNIENIPDSTELGLPVSVATVTGYLITALGGAVSVYNTTGILNRSPEYLFAHQISSLDFDTTLPPILNTIRQGDKPRSLNYWLVVQPRVLPKEQQKMFIYDSLLPYEEAKMEFGWIRAPLVFGTLVMVFLYQFSKNKGENRRKQRPFGGNLGQGRGHEFGPNGMGDIDADLKKYLSQAGAGGGGFGGFRPPNGRGGSTGNVQTMRGAF